MSVLKLTLLLAVSATACASDSADPMESSERFVGRWFIEETEAHALYGASTYQLAADGSLALEWDAGFYPEPQGHVVSPDRDVVCAFGDRWTTPDGELLIIDGTCTDDASRQIHLLFESDASLNDSGATVRIDSVDGEDGWQPPQWGWSFRKCAAGDPCRPDF